MKKTQIKLVVLDIDGVITDGTVLLLPSGDEVRSIHFHDLDAVAKVRDYGLPVAILSGEDTPASRRVARRFGISEAVFGAKDKLSGLHDLATHFGIAVEETCYVADADRDAPALASAGLGIAPADATPAARAAADHVLETPGGHGAVAAAIALLHESFVLPGRAHA